MPKTKFQFILFSLMMAFVMVYAMICYNVAIEMGGMKNEIFLIAFKELIIMWPIAFIIEALFVEKLAIKLAFRVVKPTDEPIFITIAISAMIVCLMCPLMSMVATILFANPGNQIIAIWLQKLIINFPMALFFQIFVAGPLVRNMFNLINKKNLQIENI